MDDLTALVTKIRSSSKYRHVSIDVIQSVGSRELAKHQSVKEATQATRSKLHQIGGAYQGSSLRYAVWLTEMQAAQQTGDHAQFRQICERVMTQHTSTRERLPILDRFYTEILADLPPVHSVLDLACGFNPLTIPWMSLPADAIYYAYDIYEDLMSFLQRFISLCGYRTIVGAQSIIGNYPVVPRVDLALLLKAIPCLEQVDKAAGSRLLNQIDAQNILVTYPVHSLGGRAKGMVTNYETRFMELIESSGWQVHKYTYRSELAFLLRKDDSSSIAG